MTFLMVTVADKTRIEMRDREDLANALSHFIGALLSVACLILMVVYSAQGGSILAVISSIIFGFSMILLYISSAIAHWLKEGKRKDIFFSLDQAAIFILIAGTYTPLALIALNGITGWILFFTEWIMAAIGIFRIFRHSDVPKEKVGIIDILIYILMGWLVVLVSGPVLRSIPVMGVIWIIIGGLFYTFGIVFFKFMNFRYHHLVWHLMVIAGSASHFTAIFFYILQ
jgi:hemolysin III